ncbi:AsmA-like C-terminal region-containing protein [Roseovarius sp. MMSF_3281]|uniref:AsmA-like C-terminal region-containing protein n=1 Tax=Roseovarius sp. MMSF_3281 TaxID=3046694 RepID=UPI00273DA6EC|nr:AsmA-like C-terminal region-containing protein [Roseovarius sp. MMSF_3281]
MSETEDIKPPRRLWRRAVLWLLGTVLVLVAAGAVAVMALVGTQVSAPDWLRSRITERINDDAGAMRLGLGEMSFVMDENWVPRLNLREVTVRDETGQPLANLTDVQGTFALRPLLRGELRPGEIRVSGVQVALRRSESGAMGVSLGEAAAPAVEEAPSMAALLQPLEELLREPHFSSLTRVEARNMTLRYEDARVQRAWTVDGGRLTLERAGDDLQIRGDFVLLGARDYATTLAVNYAGRMGEAEAVFGVSFEDMPARDIAGQSPALTWLEALDAPISGALRAAVAEDGQLGPLNATLQIGAGAVQPTEATKPIPFSSARSYFTYDPVRQVMQFDEVSIESPWVNVQGEGQAYLVGMEDGWPRELLGQFRVNRISANPADLYPAAVELEQVAMDLRLEMEPFRLSLGQMSLVDQGRHLVLRGEVQAEPEGWDLALDGELDGLSPARLLQLWPERVKPQTRKWIDENVKQAELSNIQLAVRSQPKSRPDVFMGFDFEGLEARFVKEVPHIKAASGHASLYDNRFVVSAMQGYVQAATGGRIDIAGTSFEVPNVAIKRGPARARLKTESTITAALSLLNEEPFRYLDKAGRSVTLAAGRAALQGQLDFLLKPNLQPDEVAFDIGGSLHDVRSEALAPGRVLAATKLEVQARNNSLTIGGEGRLGRVPIHGTYRADLGPESGGRARVEGWVELSERFADEFNIGLPPGSLSGAGRADVVIGFEKGQPGRFEMTSDLSGVGLSLRQLDWSLPPAARGALEVSGRLGTPPDLSRVSLQAAGLTAEGRVSLLPGGQLERAQFDTVRVGTWLNAPVDLIGRGAGVPPAVQVRGGTVDLRQTSLAGDGQGGGQRRAEGGPVSLALDSLQISDGISLTDFRAELDMRRGADGTFTGRVNGGAPIRGRVVPQKGRSAFRIQSDNAGGVLGSAGLLKQARDGTMDLVLAPAGRAGTYNGQLTASGLRLKDAPALAALLNAMSVVGLLEQMGGEGIHFNEVDARFQLSPERVTLYSGSAVGASMGISMDGYYFMQSGQMDMQGVISPFYLINGIGGIFTRRGEGLVGVNYELTGQAANPRVNVNPLSVFTPGMFRELFRRPPPTRNTGQGGAAQERPQEDTGQGQGR